MTFSAIKRFLPAARPPGFALQSLMAIALPVVVLAGPARGAGPEKPNGPQKSDGFERAAVPFFDAHCTECHDADTQEGNFRVDALKPAFGDPAEATRWQKVYDRVAAGEMPPKKRKVRPPADEAAALLDFAAGGLKAAAAQRYQAEGRAHRRRLNRAEYENTLRDLLGVDVRVAAMLPEDGTAHGFDTVDEALTLSAVQMEKYLEAADRAVGTALGDKPPPPFKRQRFTYLTKEKSAALERDRNARGVKLADSVAMYVSTGNNPPWAIREFAAPEPGRYRVRVSASGHQSRGKPVAFRIYDGFFLTGGSKRVTGYFEVPADAPTIVEAEAYLESARDTFQVVPYDLPGREMKAGYDKAYAGPGLRVYWVEIEGPLEAQQWPPPSRSALLGDVDPARGTEADLHAVLRRFVPRAFRRPVAEPEMAPYLAFASAQLKGGATFEQAMRAALRAVLVSPRFLMLDAAPGRLDGHALAERLSYFLWSTTPDADLLAAAAAGDLADLAELRAQVERMLSHPKAQTFTERFTDQWLELKQIDATTPDKQLYPEFDEWLKLSMVQETRAFFDELLRADLSVLSVIDSDWAMLNERLAAHYKLADEAGRPLAAGLSMQRVKLPPNSRRGGVLTHGSVLKVTANGTTTSPVIRGAWLLDRVLGTPVPPPPANVPAVEPDIRGATNIRDELAKHRDLGQCASCHIKMDPVGFALESYDVIGGWRDRYRIVADEEELPKPAAAAAAGPGNGHDPGQNKDGQAKAAQAKAAQAKAAQAKAAQPKAGQAKPGQPKQGQAKKGKPQFALGPPVDAGDTLETGERFGGIDEFKRLVLSRPEPVVRGLAEKLLVYSTGHAMEFADRDALDAIVSEAKAKNYGLRSLVHAVVQSETFRNK